MADQAVLLRFPVRVQARSCPAGYHSESCCDHTRRRKFLFLDASDCKELFHRSLQPDASRRVAVPGIASRFARLRTTRYFYTSLVDPRMGCQAHRLVQSVARDKR